MISDTALDTILDQIEAVSIFPGFIARASTDFGTPVPAAPAPIDIAAGMRRINIALQLYRCDALQARIERIGVWA